MRWHLTSGPGHLRNIRGRNLEEIFVCQEHGEFLSVVWPPFPEELVGTEFELHEGHSHSANRQHTTKERLGNWKGKDEKREALE